MKWLVHAEMVATFVHRKEISFSVEADTEEEAKKLADKAAYDEFNPDSFDAEYDDCYIDGLSIECSEVGYTPPIRCKLTPDLFMAAA